MPFIKLYIVGCPCPCHAASCDIQIFRVQNSGSFPVGVVNVPKFGTALGYPHQHGGWREQMSVNAWVGGGNAARLPGCCVAYTRFQGIAGFLAGRGPKVAE